MYYDVISGEELDGELIREAKKVEMETFKKHGVYEKVPRQECLENTGKEPVEVKWFDTNEGDKENPEVQVQAGRQGDKKRQA